MGPVGLFVYAVSPPVFSFMNEQTAVWYPERPRAAGSIFVLQCSASCSPQCNGITEVCLLREAPRPRRGPLLQPSWLGRRFWCF